MSTTVVAGMITGLIVIPMIVFVGQIRRRLHTDNKTSRYDITSIHQLPASLWIVMALTLMPALAGMVLALLLAIGRPGH